MKENQKAQEVLTVIDDISSDDENLERLEKAMQYFCSNYDICEGYKHALNLTIIDQSQNHAGENDLADYDKLLAILNAK